MTSPFEHAGAADALHIPVLLREVIRHLDLKPGLVVVDGTIGAGGHSAEILKRIGPDGTLIGLDRDPLMLTLATRKVAGTNCHFIHASYAEIESVLNGLGIAAADRILLDLGLSSDQLADPVRGFGFQTAGPLDMRYDTSRGEPATRILAQASETELADIFYKFGEEPFSRRIARHLVEYRKSNPLVTAADLSAAVTAALPAHVQHTARKQPATRVFQALRIAVNDELNQLEQALDQALYNSLRPGGQVVIISFQSLEDRLVKQAFRDSRIWQTLTPKPIQATAAEQRLNPRCRTAKLRAAKRK